MEEAPTKNRTLSFALPTGGVCAKAHLSAATDLGHCEAAGARSTSATRLWVQSRMREIGPSDGPSLRPLGLGDNIAAGFGSSAAVGGSLVMAGVRDWLAL